MREIYFMAKRRTKVRPPKQYESRIIVFLDFLGFKEIVDGTVGNGNNLGFRERLNPSCRSDLPDGRRADFPVQPLLQKYSGFPKTQITSISAAVSSHMRGGSRSSRTRGGMRWTRQRWACDG